MELARARSRPTADSTVQWNPSEIAGCNSASGCFLPDESNIGRSAAIPAFPFKLETVKQVRNPKFDAINYPATPRGPLQSKFDSLTNSLRVSAKKRKGFMNPEESIGTLLMTFPEDGCKLWDLKGPALEVQTALEKEINDCLLHADLRKTVYRNYHMQGKTEKTAIPVVIIWGADKLTRRQAKERLKKEVLVEQKYDGWKIRLAERNPIFQSLISLMNRAWSETDSVQFSTRTLSFWKDQHTGTCVIRNDKVGERVIGTVCGPIQILGNIFYFTSAHIFTGRSPFDEVLIQGKQRPAVSQTGFDSSDDESDEDKTDDDDVSMLKSSGIDTLSVENIIPSTGQREPNWRRVTQTLGQDSHQLGATDLTSDTRDLFERIWPAQTITMRLGPPELDYALFQTPPGVFPIDMNSGFFGFDWHLPDDKESLPPTGNVMINTTHRGILHGSFLSTPLSVNKPGDSDVHQLWVYWPDNAAVIQGVGPKNGVRPGDSGAWIFREKKIYGYVVAGDPNIGSAVVVPSYVLYNNLKNNIGIPELLPAPTSSRSIASQRDNSVTRTTTLWNEKVAEAQPSKPHHRRAVKFPCVFHGSDRADVTEDCATKKRFVSQLRRHHGRHNFFYCERCFVQFFSREDQEAHPQSRDCVFQCAAESCYNFGLTIDSSAVPCQHTRENTQRDKWRQLFRMARPQEDPPDPDHNLDPVVQEPLPDFPNFQKSDAQNSSRAPLVNVLKRCLLLAGSLETYYHDSMNMSAFQELDSISQQVHSILGRLQLVGDRVGLTQSEDTDEPGLSTSTTSLEEGSTAGSIASPLALGPYGLATDCSMFMGSYEAWDHPRHELPVAAVHDTLDKTGSTIPPKQTHPDTYATSRYPAREPMVIDE